MNVTEFRHKWQGNRLTERSASQQHFLDLCALAGHPPPAAVDTTGQNFTFERGAAKHGGGDGWADVWKRGFFGWEYKGPRKDLEAAYDQLLKYREALDNPPLLVVSDMDRIVVRTNFTGTPTETHEVTLDTLGDPRSLEVLRAVFHDPDRLRPGRTSEAMTAEAASRVAAVAQGLRERGVDPELAARFLDRVVFCLFAEDIDLLPGMVFTRMLDKTRRDPERFAKLTEQLFEAMRAGGDFGVDEVRAFDGHLFENVAVVELTTDELETLYAAALLDWAAVDPSIFGTLFERGMDPAKRAQLGAHYTSRADIETLVDPVVMWPLRRRWDEVREVCERLVTTGRKTPGGGDRPPSKQQLTKGYREADILIRLVLQELAAVKVLDPACGSGNFLYVTLQKLKDFEKEIIVWAMDNHLGGYFPQVGPWQLCGIEINPYAFELAQMTVWIGFLQWTRANGFPLTQDPVLRPMNTFHLMDAILDLSEPESPKEPEWPRVDFIVGNPPFLGGKLLRRELGDNYVDQMFRVWEGRVPREADLCCYWFERARSEISRGRCRRAGLLATQAIRGGANRTVLTSIKRTGDIFFAESDRPWVLDGANVHVSIVAFDDGTDDTKCLDGKELKSISASLSGSTDVTRARRLPGNSGLSFMGDTKGGAFELPEQVAQEMLESPNPNGRPSSDVVTPWVNGLDLTRRPRALFIIDFGADATLEYAAGFERPFEFVRRQVQPSRAASRTTIESWWRHERPRPEMRRAVATRERFLGTPRVTKHRLFLWLSSPTLPDSQVIVVACDDDYYLGVLHARPHEVWARVQGTQLRERESGFRYTPTTCFETFPFPWPPGAEPSGDCRLEAVAAAAHELDELRERWLNPPEWVREEVLEFPGSMDGPWSRWIHESNQSGIGTVRWPRLVPRDAECAARLKKRTLTNLYNERPTWLDLAHRRLDEAVFACYGWPTDLSDDQILERLLELNLERAGTSDDATRKDANPHEH